MLDNLVESKSHKGENRKFRGLFFITSFSLISFLAIGLIYSLFNQSTVLGAEAFEISELISPVEIPAQEPPAPMPENVQQETTEKTVSKIPSRMENIQRLDESPVKAPDKISVTPSKSKARPNTYFNLGKSDSDDVRPSNLGIGKPGKNGTGIQVTDKGAPKVVADDTKKDIEEPPALPTKPKKVEKVDRIISGGVINGKATDLVMPVYTSAAKNVGAKGQVKIEVTIDENGNVISAGVVSGHPLLRQSALRAARSSKFSPTYLSEQKVKVKGFIIYNFSG